ncbi:hypothetical protein E3O21_05395 [Cryobacterium flavum]|uniref:Uncharacterized protein n=1 Tax=Cryobacterium flavum TaxID=1424659 RepID=A0ABY2I681_9MICO|nr:hypothetical protein E3O21_06360 [Cryobacterium flavum]TFB78547.1 hypothetical protein E3O21_05395 [Cryobacterium flavum]
MFQDVAAPVLEIVAAIPYPGAVAPLYDVNEPPMTTRSPLGEMVRAFTAPSGTVPFQAPRVAVKPVNDAILWRDCPLAVVKLPPA